MHSEQYAFGLLIYLFIMWLGEITQSLANYKAMEYGEAWTKYSYVQLIGFCLLFIGTMIYNAVIKIPGSKYEVPVQAKKEETVRLIANDKTPNESIN